MHIVIRWISIITGCFAVSLGVHLLSSSELVIGGTAGMGIVAQHLSAYSFGTLFFVINLPFYALAVTQLGMAFTLRTFISVSILSITSEFLQQTFIVHFPHPVIAAILGGISIGIGLIFLFRNGSSLGGMNILCIFLEKKFGFNPGRTMLITDLMIVGSALLVFGPLQIVYSAIAIFVMTAILGRYHKKAPLERESGHAETEENGVSATA
ncbi:YitT family protein [Metabacillus indicus]|uniref:YitT family protein n=1 Tax=Metabacillus indicus TaxID=246786 RepID=UPI003CF5EBA3